MRESGEKNNGLVGLDVKGYVLGFFYLCFVGIIIVISYWPSYEQMSTCMNAINGNNVVLFCSIVFCAL